MQADCRLDAVIGRLTLSLRQVMTLAVGETLALPRSALDAISLETIEGQRVAGARLGQHRGMRALKLNEAVTTRAGAGAGAGAAAAPRPAKTDEPPPTELRAAG